MEVPTFYPEQENITYVSSPNLNGLVELSTLTVETTTATKYDYDLLQPSLTTKKIEETPTRKMRKVLKRIYKRPIHSNNYKIINKQNVLLELSDSEKDLLTVMKEKLTDVIKSDKSSMNESAATSTVFENLNEEYKETLEGFYDNGVSVKDADNNIFGEVEADMKFKRDHQNGGGM